MKTLIVTGGALDISFIRQYQRSQGFDYLIASDYGLHFFAETDTVPDEVVGDFDSANVRELEKIQAMDKVGIHTFPVKKDATDTELALRLALERGSGEIHIVGFSGSRFDHMLGTLRIMGLALEKKTPVFLVDSCNRVRLLEGPAIETIRKEEQYGEYLSFLPLKEEVKGLTLDGFAYPLKDAVLGGYNSLGISNRIIEPEATITLGQGVLVMVEAKDGNGR